MMNLIMSNYPNVIFSLLLLIIVIQLFEIIRLKSKANHFESEMKTYASGIIRVMDFISEKDLIEEYCDFSLKKYGEKKREKSESSKKEKLNE